MAENINFIPANELPVAEGDEVSVLCLENGELKQKTASLGGSVIIHTTTNIPWDGDEEHSVSPVPSGTFERIRSGLVNGAPITVVEVNRYTGSNEDGSTFGGYCSCPAYYDYINASDGFPEAVVFDGCNTQFVLLSDDRIMTMQEFGQEMGGGE